MNIAALDFHISISSQTLFTIFGLPITNAIGIERRYSVTGG